MIIFELDGTLADCEHRRHFVDPEKNENFCRWNGDDFRSYKDGQIRLNVKWKPDWQAFYEACDQDKLIVSTGRIYEHIAYSAFSSEVQIWSGRCESQREKTLEWIIKNLYWSSANREYLNSTLKMRPIGDNTPDDQLKERWLDAAIAEGKTVDFVFDGTETGCDMWNRNGIMCFLVKPGSRYEKTI